MPPRFEMLMPPPLISSSVSFRSRAFAASWLISTEISRDVLPVGVADHRHEQAAIGVHGHADVHVLLVDDLAALGVDRGVELRELLDRGRQDLHQHRRDREVAARLGDLILELLAQLLERGDVRLVELRDVRDGVPGVAEVLGGRAPDVGPAAGARPRPTSGSPAARRVARAARPPRPPPPATDAAQDPPRMLLDVVLGDAAARPAALHLVDVRRRSRGPDGAPPARRRRPDRGRRCRGVRACPAEAAGAGAGSAIRGGIGSDLVRPLRLRASAFGLVSDWLPAGGSGGCGAGCFGSRFGFARFAAGLCRAAPAPLPAAAPSSHGQDDRADLDLVALLDPDFLDGAGDRRRHLDGGLVGLELEHRLIAGDGVADVDHHAHHVAAGDVLAQLGNFEFSHGRDVCATEIAGIRLLRVDSEILDRLLHDRRRRSCRRARGRSASPPRCAWRRPRRSRAATARPSLRPKPSVPSDVSRRGSQRSIAVRQHLHVVGRRDDHALGCRRGTA